MPSNLPITVLIAARNEEVNISKCLDALGPAQRVIILDSHSVDNTAQIAQSKGAEVVQFDYAGGYPKKRQWALDTLDIKTPWVFLLDADEVVTPSVWEEIAQKLDAPNPPSAWLITKGFHFMGRRFRFGGFSFSALLLFKTGTARFEHIVNESADALDMEVHERLLVDGTIGKINSPIIHEDFKGLEAYLDRHNKYSTWEASVRQHYFSGSSLVDQELRPNLFGNVQQRRRFLKTIAIRMPLEPQLWFVYHYFFRLGFLEGMPGLIAARIRSQYISQVRAKLYELRNCGEHL